VLQAGITYIAQVLKRNRTLKVLNLSENKLDVAGLVAIAEGLVRLQTICEELLC
jgi:protein phosphatase 1 regulatory subunit 37